MSSTPEGSMRPPTLDAVAARAGVSRSTVSRVVNDSPRVAPEARDAVHRAIADLGYVPNRSARSLAMRRSDSVAVVIPAAEAGRFPTPYFASVMQGVVDAGSANNYAIRILPSNAVAPPSRGMLLGEGVSGAVVVACASTDAHYAALDSTVPIVFVGRPLADRAHYVAAEQERGAAEAAHYLVARGRHRVAMIAGSSHVTGAVERLAGWRRALQEHGVSADLVEQGDLTPESGAEAMRRLLLRDERLDAVLVANDQMAAGAYSAILASGSRIPEDIAVIGFDNDDYFGATARPALTTVDQRSAELGAAALEVLLGRLAKRPVPRVTRLRTRLLVRDSS